MKLLFLGDYCTNKQYKLGNSFLNLLDKVDYSILNLEGPFYSKSQNLPNKFGPRLNSDANIFLKNFCNKKTIIAGANNHIFDYGNKGIVETIKILKKNKFKYFGFGLDNYEASKPLKLNDIILYNFAENEFGVSKKYNPGFSGINYSLIKKIKTEASQKKIIIYFHGGTEYCSVPNPFIRKLYKTLLDSGVMAIIGSHTHIPQMYKMLNNQFFCFSLGNFIFIKNKNIIKNFLRKLFFNEFIINNSYFNYGIGVELDIQAFSLNYKIHKLKFSKGCLEICNDSTLIELLDRVNSYDEKTIDLKWNKFVKKILPNYQKYYNYNLKNSKIAKINFNNTESHREVLKILFNN